MRELGGLGFENVPRAAPLGVPVLPVVVPFIDHRYSRSTELDEPVVALSLYEVVNLATGELHIRTREELSARFLIPATASVVLSGVGKDPAIERWWELPNRSVLLAGLCQLGIAMITSPNYSVLSDVPRTDNLYAMKRILLAWTEMAAAGLPTALHVNARTEQDYTRWGDLIRTRSEIETLAFEFATGCGRGGRIDWHVDQLRRLPDLAGRPLSLVIRGGGRKLVELREQFAHVAILETDAFTRTHRRRRAYFTEAGRLRWARYLTGVDENLDELLAHNVGFVRDDYTRKVDMPRELHPPARPQMRLAANRNCEAGQPSFLSDFDMPCEVGAISRECQGMVATAKP